MFQQQNKQYHILNGDALKAHFPSTITGEIIVARECLVDGDVCGKTLEILFSNRAKFIANTYKESGESDYYTRSVTEFERIQRIPKNVEINLWFEDDLFCQVNLWFIFHLLKEKSKDYPIYLIRPNSGNEYNFGKMNKPELIEAYQNRIKITNAEFLEFRKLWQLFQKNDIVEMENIADVIKDKYPFLIPAIKAHKDRLPQNAFPGKPVQTLIQIINELKTTEFEPVFQEFCKREAIYGFGDVQVKRMFDELIAGKPN